MDDLFNRVARRRRPGQGGFTLIELLVVIAVLAILAAIVIFNVLGVVNRGSSSACATDVKSAQTAVDAYYNDHQKYPTDWTADTPPLVPNYLHTAPTSAETGTVTWPTTGASGNNGTISFANCP